jgi:hypothetical protein
MPVCRKPLTTSSLLEPARRARTWPTASSKGAFVPVFPTANEVWLRLLETYGP